MKTAVYTAAFGNCETPAEVPAHIVGACKADAIPLICFTDKTRHSNTWQMRRMFGGRTCRKPTLTARHCKIMFWHFLPGYEKVIWVDSKSNLKNPPWKMEAPGDFALASHDKRCCAYDEIKACIDQRKDARRKLEVVEAMLGKDGFPESFGLWMTGLLIRKNSILCRKFCDQWWYAVHRYTVRDQITLPWLIWKYKFQVATLTKEQSDWCVDHGRR